MHGLSFACIYFFALENAQWCAVSCKCLTESRYGLLLAEFSWNSGVSASVVSIASVSLLTEARQHCINPVQKEEDNTIGREETE